MSGFKIYKTPANIEKFITMVLMGVSVKDICEEIGMARPTYYTWFEDKEIMAEIDKRRNEIKDEGLAYIKARYKKYLKNIDALCDDTTDRRTCLAANQFMVEKMDGKNVAKLETTDNQEKKSTQVNVLKELNKLNISPEEVDQPEESLNTH